jgi:hypothetical protein
MQAASGSRGARVYDASELDEDFAFVSNTIENTTAAAMLPNRSDTGMWVTTAGINIRDQIRKDDLTPLQFKYEAADCRLFYTVANIFNMSRLWHDVAAATWNNASLCVTGSTGFPSARNTSSTQAPPRRTAQLPLLSLDLADSVAITGNGTVGILDSGSRQTGEIKSCQTNSDCNGDLCLGTNLRCGTIFKPVSACLPKCSNYDPSCPGTSECDYDDTPSPSKLNTVVGRKAVLRDTLRLGHCRPTVPNRKLACPR